MNRETMDQLVERWHGDAEFRAALRADPEGTLAREGIALSNAERAALRGLGLDRVSDAELEARISKEGGFGGSC
jgi:hypothetical protein